MVNMWLRYPLQQQINSRHTCYYCSRYSHRYVCIKSSKHICRFNHRYRNDWLSVLNIFPDRNIIRAITESTAGIHTASTDIIEIVDNFTIPLRTPFFSSKLDDKIFFNPTQELGIGTVSGQAGISTIVIGNVPTETSIPNQSIFIPNHPFKQNQQVTLTKGGSTRIVASNTGDSATFNIPESGETQTLFVINKSKNLIGLTTEVGLTTSTDGLFFRCLTQIIMILTLNILLNLISLKRLLELRKLNLQYQYQLLMV